MHQSILLHGEMLTVAEMLCGLSTISYKPEAIQWWLTPHKIKITGSIGDVQEFFPCV